MNTTATHVAPRGLAARLCPAWQWKGRDPWRDRESCFFGKNWGLPTVPNCFKVQLLRSFTESFDLSLSMDPSKKHSKAHIQPITPSRDVGPVFACRGLIALSNSTMAKMVLLKSPKASLPLALRSPILQASLSPYLYKDFTSCFTTDFIITD